MAASVVHQAFVLADKDSWVDRANVMSTNVRWVIIHVMRLLKRALIVPVDLSAIVKRVMNDVKTVDVTTLTSANDTRTVAIQARYALIQPATSSAIVPLRIQRAA